MVQLDRATQYCRTCQTRHSKILPRSNGRTYAECDFCGKKELCYIMADRETEPWLNYNDCSWKQVIKTIATASFDLCQKVWDYEIENRGRSTVLWALEDRFQGREIQDPTVYEEETSAAGMPVELAEDEILNEEALMPYSGPPIDKVESILQSRREEERKEPVQKALAEQFGEILP